jgi:hypothetical protein
MASDPSVLPLFPEFERFVRETELLTKVKGALSPKIHRIVGQGRTRAEGLDLPPSPIERKRELIALNVSKEFALPDSVFAEIEGVRKEVEAFLLDLKEQDGLNRLARQVLRDLGGTLGVQTGNKDNCYFADGLVLVHQKQGEEWAWSLTRHYPVVSKIPPDLAYLKRAFEVSHQRLQDMLLPLEEFDFKLGLAWAIAKHYAGDGEVYLIDVARVFKVAAQSNAFWQNPKKMLFADFPEALFLANLVNWRRRAGSKPARFQFVPATVHDAHGPKARVFFMPANDEGTQVRPIVYMRRID